MYVSLKDMKRCFPIGNIKHVILKQLDCLSGCQLLELKLVVTVSCSGSSTELHFQMQLYISVAFIAKLNCACRRAQQ